jgi:hypothetical protein
MGSLAANMGAATEDEIMAFAEAVRAALGFTHTFEWSEAEPSICMDTQIFLRRTLISTYVWQAKEEVLHEVTHVFAGNGHGERFYVVYAYLLRRFLGGRQRNDVQQEEEGK